MAFPTQSIDLEASSNQYATVADTGVLDIANACTMEVWIKPETTPGHYIMSKRKAAGNQRSFSMEYSGSSLSCFFDNTGAGGAGKSASVSWSPSTGTWYHVAVTKNGTNIKFYVDGVQQGTTQTISNSAVFNSTAPFQLGTESGDPGAEFDGRMVLARLWSVERTQSEIDTNKCTILGATTGLVGEWTLNNTYADNSGNGLTLTGVNTPTFGADVPTVCAVVGPTNLKTWNGLAKASIKTINGVPIASVKTINGLT